MTPPLRMAETETRCVRCGDLIYVGEQFTTDEAGDVCRRCRPERIEHTPKARIPEMFCDDCGQLTPHEVDLDALHMRFECVVCGTWRSS